MKEIRETGNVKGNCRRNEEVEKVFVGKLLQVFFLCEKESDGGNGSSAS